MGSHSVTCHPAEVTFPPLPQPIKADTRFSDPRGMQGRVDLVGLVTYRGGIPAGRRSPIPVLTGLNVEQLRSCDERRYHHAEPPWRVFTPRIRLDRVQCCIFRVVRSRWTDCAAFHPSQAVATFGSRDQDSRSRGFTSVIGYRRRSVECIDVSGTAVDKRSVT